MISLYIPFLLHFCYIFFLSSLGLATFAFEVSVRLFMS